MILDFSSPEVAGVKWLNPTQLFEQIRLPAAIAQMMQNRTLNFAAKAKGKAKNQKAK